MTSTLTMGVRKLVGGSVQSATRLMYGAPVPYISTFTQTLGVKKTFQGLGAIQKIAKHLERHYGPFRSQLLIGCAAIWHGCPFCSVGHLHAANLHYFRDTGSLLSLSESDIPQLMRQRDSEVAQSMQRALSDADPELARLVERQYLLSQGKEADASHEDELLKASLAAWAWLTECSVFSDTTNIPPLDPAVAKDKALRERYQAARAS